MDGYIGEIRFFAGNYAPFNWALCNGQLIAISQHSALYSIIGNFYGGDGRSTFALPDLRGRMIIGPGQGPGLNNFQIGQQTGFESMTLTENHLPSHNHSQAMQATTAAGNTADPTGAVLADAGRFDNEFHNDPGSVPPVNMASGETGLAGGNQSFQLRAPSLVMHAIICLYGSYPTRS